MIKKNLNTYTSLLFMMYYYDLLLEKKHYLHIKNLFGIICFDSDSHSDSDSS